MTSPAQETPFDTLAKVGYTECRAPSGGRDAAGRPPSFPSEGGRAAGVRALAVYDDLAELSGGELGEMARNLADDPDAPASEGVCGTCGFRGPVVRRTRPGGRIDMACSRAPCSRVFVFLAVMDG